MTDQTKKDEILKEIQERAKLGREGWSQNWERMDEDVDFADGNHWPEDIKKSRDDEDRPYLTFNKAPAYIDQVIGEQRKSKPAIDVFPSEGDSGAADLKIQNLAGTQDYSLAEVYQGLIRQIEYISSADMAYDTAYEHGVGHGLGYFEIVPEYGDEDTFDQDLKIKRVRNWRSVVPDPAFEEPDGSDMMWCFKFTKIHKNEFDRRFKGKERASVEHDADIYETWADGEYVRIAEYYRLVPVKKKLNLMSNGAVYDDEKMKPIKDELAERGITIEKSRTVETHKVEWMKVSGVDILEGPLETVFHAVPIIPVLGKELMVKGDPIYRGVIRNAKDPMRLYNYWRTATTESVALQPKAPWVLSDKQLGGYQEFWDNANKKNLPYLVFAERPNGTVPQRQAPPPIPAGMVNETMTADADIRATMGMFQPDIGQPEGAQSGIAIDKLQKRGDNNNFTYADNLTRSIRHAGRLLVRAIPKIYDSERVIRLRFPDDTEDFVTINKTIRDDQTGKDVTINDLSVGKYDVLAKAGPSYSTQRQEAADAIFAVMGSVGASNPTLQSALGMLAIKNMDWPEADEVVKLIKKSLPPGLIEPEEDEEPPPPPQPTPQDQANIAKAEAEIAKAEATKAKAAADIEKAEAEMVKAQATLMEVAERMENLDETIKDAVAGAFVQLITEMNQSGGNP